MMNTIRDWRGWILGYVDEDMHGNKTAMDFHHRILGYYKADRDVTTDFYNRDLAHGDLCEGLIYKNQDN